MVQARHIIIDYCSKLLMTRTTLLVIIGNSSYDRDYHISQSSESDWRHHPRYKITAWKVKFRHALRQ